MSQIDSGEAARALGALRKKGPRTCAVCGTTFEGFSNQRYCGNSCQQKAYRKRYQSQLKEKRRAKYARAKEGQG